MNLKSNVNLSAINWDRAIKIGVPVLLVITILAFISRIRTFIAISEIMDGLFVFAFFAVLVFMLLARVTGPKPSSDKPSGKSNQP